MVTWGMGIWASGNLCPVDNALTLGPVGRVQVWGGFGSHEIEDNKRAYLMLEDHNIIRMLHWQQFIDEPGFGTDAKVNVKGHRQAK